MMDFLQPVDDELIEFSLGLSEHQIGRNITQISLSDEEFFIKKGSLVILFVPEYRGCSEDKSHDEDKYYRLENHSINCFWEIGHIIF